MPCRLPLEAPASASPPPAPPLGLRLRHRLRPLRRRTAGPAARRTCGARCLQAAEGARSLRRTATARGWVGGQGGRGERPSPQCAERTRIRFKKSDGDSFLAANSLGSHTKKRSARRGRARTRSGEGHACRVLHLLQGGLWRGFETKSAPVGVKNAPRGHSCAQKVTLAPKF